MANAPGHMLIVGQNRFFCRSWAALPACGSSMRYLAYGLFCGQTVSLFWGVSEGG